MKYIDYIKNFVTKKDKPIQPSVEEDKSPWTDDLIKSITDHISKICNVQSNEIKTKIHNIPFNGVGFVFDIDDSKYCMKIVLCLNNHGFYSFHATISSNPNSVKDDSPLHISDLMNLIRSDDHLNPIASNYLEVLSQLIRSIIRRKEKEEKLIDQYSEFFSIVTEDLIMDMIDDLSDLIGELYISKLRDNKNHNIGYSVYTDYRTDTVIRRNEFIQEDDHSFVTPNEKSNLLTSELFKLSNRLKKYDATLKYKISLKTGENLLTVNITPIFK